MEIVVKGRNVEVPDHFRAHVADKLTKSERYDGKIIRVDVELSHETNPRQAKNCQRVQITLGSKGPAMRAESTAETFYSALDTAVHRLESQLRKAADRRHDRERTPALAVAASPEELDGSSDPVDGAPAAVDDDGPGRVVRIKDHPGEPITVDQALYQMELVGHDFYLFKDVETRMCSVVYRRKGFDYGLLRLAETTSADTSPAGHSHQAAGGQLVDAGLDGPVG